MTEVPLEEPEFVDGLPPADGPPVEPGKYVERVTGGPNVEIVNVGGQLVPMPNEPRCLTCQSPHRMWIEAELIRGTARATIVSLLEGMWDGGRRRPTEASIRQHVKMGHGNIPARRRMELINDEAVRQGVDQAIQDVDITPRVIVDEILLSGHDRLVTGKIVPDGRLVMQAAALRAKMDAEDSDSHLSRDLYTAMVDRMLSIMSEQLPHPIFSQTMQAFSNDNLLRALSEKVRDVEGSQD